MENTENLVDEIKTLKEESKKINSKAREHYLEQVSDLSEKIKQLGGEAGTKAKQVLDKASEYIDQNPQKSALIGLGVGVGLGLLVGLMIRNKK